MSGVLPTPTPDVNPETEHYWRSAAEGRFVARRCRSCGTTIWYPRPICPSCWSHDTEWFEASGRGTVYSHTTVYRGEGAFAGIPPYVVALVTLEEGPTVLTNVVGDPEAVTVGSAVEVELHPSDDDAYAVPRFRLVDGRSDPG